MKNKKNIFVKTIIEEIKKNKRLPKTRPLILEDILYKDENDKTLLEYMLENTISYHYDLIPNISSSFEAAKIFYKFNKLRELPNLNNKVYFVENNSLVACFDDNVNINIIDEICKYNPLKVVFKDVSFKSDKDKINLEERIKKLSPETEISIL